MIKVFYIEDNNGQYVSADGSKRWTRLTGQALYDFLQTERGKKTYFFTDTDENGNSVGIEIIDTEVASELRRNKNHSDYLRQVREESGYTTISFDYIETENGTSSGDEVIPNGDESVEDCALRNINIEILRKALNTLTIEEYSLIYSLYLQDNPMTERAFSKKMGIPQKTINDRKARVLKKLKSFF